MKQMKYIQVAHISKKIIRKFYHDESGVYGVMTVLLTAGLIGYIAFVVDGTGILLDKARFTQGLEQAGLLLTAEGNYYRDNKNTWEVNSQQNFPTGKLTQQQKNLIRVFEDHTKENHINFHGDIRKRNFTYKQYLRNIQMLEKLVRSYYLPESYISYSKGGNTYNNFNIDDHFNYRCGYLKAEYGITNNIGCIVNGSFMRPSWLYWGEKYKNEYGTTFHSAEKITSDTVFVTKKRENVPVDIILVSDLSSSMNERLDTDDYSIYPVSKISMLRRVFTQISSEILKPSETSIPNYNRIGFIDFALGAQLPNYQIEKCVLPFITLRKYFITTSQRDYPGGQVRVKRTSIKDQMEYELTYGNPSQYWPYYQDSIDYQKTLSLIDSFRENNLMHLDPSMVTFRKNIYCLGQNNPANFISNNDTTRAWYTSTPQSLSKALYDFNKVNPMGATLSSAGLIIGANMMMHTNPATKKLRSNTQRIIVILSDGRDQPPYGYTSKITQTLLDPAGEGSLIANHINNAGIKVRGLCERIRERLNSLQKTDYRQFPSKISFIAFGYDGDQSGTAAAEQKRAWLKCVGKNYYQANNEKELLDAFRSATTAIEEVGSEGDKTLKFAD